MAGFFLPCSPQIHRLAQIFNDISVKLRICGLYFIFSSQSSAMLESKVHFIKQDYIPLLHKLTADQKGEWGKMDGQQMVEHMRDIFKLASGKILVPLVNTDPERLARSRAFLLTEDPFPPNVKGPGVAEEPRPHKYSSLAEAISKLEPEIEAVFTAYANEPGKLLMHPVFGELDYELQIRYLDKHARHHLRQFGLVD